MGKIIAITGVSRGLGRALSEKFIAVGHTVIGCARSPKAMQELKEKYGQPHSFTAVDVIDEAIVKTWSESFLSSPPDLLINNAALVNHPAPLWEVPSEEFSELIDVNIKGVANVIRHVLPAMIERQQGIVVNISSGWGRSTSPNVAPYCASKWAIEGLTQALAQELPPGMLVSRSFRHLDKIGREAIGKEIKSDLQGNSYDYRRTRRANSSCQISKFSV